MSALNGNKPVWIRDNDHGFVIGKISDIATDNVTVQLSDSGKVYFERKTNIQMHLLFILYLFLRKSLFRMIQFFKLKNTIKMSMIIVIIFLIYFLKLLFFFLIGALMYLNEGTLLNNLRRRYKKDAIYVCELIFFSFYCIYISLIYRLM